MPNPKRAAFVVEVVGGEDHGARLEVGDRVCTIGRARDADLILRDPGVSRRHLQVVATETGVSFSVCPDAAPFLVGGRSLRSMEGAVGERVLIGNTTLQVTSLERDASADPLAGRGPSDVRTVLTGLGADARAMAAVHALIEWLDSASDVASLATALSAWGQEQIPSCSVEIRRGSAASSQFVQHEEGGATEIAVPCPAAEEPVSLVFRCAAPAENISDSFRRMLVVGGRLFSSSLDRLHRAEVADGEVAALRALSFGTAHDFLGSSDAAKLLSVTIGKVAASDVTVLLEGETGSGKTFIARLIHESSTRAKEPLRVINCAAIPDSLVEAELFGHERGAFTGATNARAGALEAAGAGTVLLDEIGELPIASQAKLLSVLEAKRFERVGSNRSVPLRARVIAATNRDLEQMVGEGSFRSDLYFRIAVLKLRVPPLRERGDDLVLLAARMLADLAPSAGRRIEGFSPSALEAIRRYPWPGNARELRNAIERALVVGDGPQIKAADLPDALLAGAPPQPTDASLVRLPAKLDWLEERAIEAALAATGGNQSRAAVVLGINRVTLNRKLRGRSDAR